MRTRGRQEEDNRKAQGGIGEGNGKFHLILTLAMGKNLSTRREQISPSLLLGRILHRCNWSARETFRGKWLWAILKMEKMCYYKLKHKKLSNASGT